MLPLLPKDWKSAVISLAIAVAGAIIIAAVSHNAKLDVTPKAKSVISASS